MNVRMYGNYDSAKRFLEPFLLNAKSIDSCTFEDGEFDCCLSIDFQPYEWVTDVIIPKMFDFGYRLNLLEGGYGGQLWQLKVIAYSQIDFHFKKDDEIEIEIP